MRWQSAYATAGAPAAPRPVAVRPAVPPRGAVRAGHSVRPRRLVDLRAGQARVRRLRYPAGDILIVSGLPGGGKSTLMRRVSGDAWLIDSQDVRERWQTRMPRLLPYAAYRPLVRLAHYVGLWRALRSGAGVALHDCGTLPWVRAWVGREARRRGRGMHLVLLDVPVEAALDGQRVRGRGVSAYAMARHQRASRRLLRAAEKGRLPAACTSAVLLDREAARRLEAIDFDG